MGEQQRRAAGKKRRGGIRGKKSLIARGIEKKEQDREQTGVFAGKQPDRQSCIKKKNRVKKAVQGHTKSQQQTNRLTD